VSCCCDAVIIIEPFTFCRDVAVQRKKESVIKILKECAEKSDALDPDIINEHSLLEHHGNKGSVFILAGTFNYLSEGVAEEFCEWIRKNEPRIELAQLLYHSNENSDIDRTLQHQEKWGLF